MNSIQFQLNKIKRLIKTQGDTFVFTGKALNEFGEPSDEILAVPLDGVFHETTSYLTRTSTESTTLRAKPSPMILCLWEDAKKLSISYELFYNGKLYRIGDIKNVSESNIAADISLEEVQTDGKFPAGHKEPC